ncbi:unnamed protein product [Sphagnum troendelagicum]|uniref:Uncharacterized protein n=1 Tax=Sphagnum troendelagicum TaxID=128251 RepID=A0ABP0T798_9BRYO
MTFMVVDTDSYDILLGLDLLIKIGAIVDVDQGLIQVRQGPGSDVEVLPLTMVNLVQRLGEGPDYHNHENAHKRTPRISDGVMPLNEPDIGEQEKAQQSGSTSDSSEDFNEMI